MQDIRVVQRDVGFGRVIIGVEHDHRAEVIRFIGLPTYGLENPLVVLKWAALEAGSPAGQGAVLLSEDDMSWSWSIMDAITQYATPRYSLAGYIAIWADGRFRWSSHTFSITVGDLPEDQAVDAITLSAIDQMLVAMQAHDAGMTEQEARITALGGRIEELATGVTDKAQQVDEDAKQVEADYQAVTNLAKQVAGDAARSEQAAARSEDGAVAASSSAERAESAYARMMGIDLVVDVSQGKLRLYSAGLDSAIDIVLNDRTLEVYQV